MGITRLKIENLSKQYRLGEVGTGSLMHDLNRFWHKLRGKEDPYSMVGEENDRSKKADSDYVWALQDINFEVKEGEVLGIIGKNGAGKSTLLKILSQVTGPTTGEVKINGRIGSLLEVGTGMHPELTGRENIYLNGAILGMSKAEIKKNFDAIVDFAGIAAYVDTPFKRYSSGMRVRLGFAVAAFLEPEILIVDEVLAVGDAEFQRKAIDKIKDISHGGGRTVLFVSHNLTSIEALCPNTIVLKNGMIDYIGDSKSAISHYLKESKLKHNISFDLSDAPGNESIKLMSAKIINYDGSNLISIDDEIEIEIEYQVLGVKSCGYNLSVSIYDDKEFYLLASPSDSDKNWFNKPHPVGKFKSRVVIPSMLLNQGTYLLSILLIENANKVICELDKNLSFELTDLATRPGNFYGSWQGALRTKLNWNTIKYDQ